MLAISIVNLILSIFGITVSSIFILFWCGRYFCARFFIARVRGSGRFIFSGSGQGRRVVEHNSSGVNPLIIAYFPTLTFRQDLFLPRQDAMCAVCLGEYKEEELLRMLPQCGHNFHVNCIDIWLQQHATCPVCRMSLQGYFVGRSIAPLHPIGQLRSGSQTSSTHLDVPLSSSDAVVANHPRETATPGESIACDLPVQVSESSVTCDIPQQEHESNTTEQPEGQPTAGNSQDVNERPDIRVIDVGLAHQLERG